MEDHVVIVGGGFGGLAAAKQLADAPLRVTLLDRRNHHLFQPLLYQVATAGLGATDIAAPLRSIFRGASNTRVVLGDVTDIDLDAKEVVTEHGPVPYDVLVLAAGATHSYFGKDDWAAWAPGLKTLEDAMEIRRRILLAFEQAEIETNEAARAALLTFVIIGGGPTGVELAGAIAEMARHTLAGEFRHFDPSTARVVLLDLADRVLPTYVPSLSEAARRQLEQLGVEVQTETRVLDVDADGVRLEDGMLAARTVLWAAGVAASPLGRALGVPVDRSGRVMVEPDLSVPGHPEAFVIGDLAAVRIDHDEWVPGVAPAAMQQGEHVARNVRARLAGSPTEPFEYSDRGMMATIGRSAAVADVFGLRFSGLPAWLAWLFVHVLFLVGFRNRVSVLFDWAWAYVTYERTARVVASGLATTPAGDERDEGTPRTGAA